MNYTSKERIEAYLQRSLTADEDVLLSETIDYISSFINSYTNRNWLDVDPDEYSIESEARLYDGDGEKELFIDDFIDLEKVEILDSQGNVILTLDDSDEFILYPANSSVKQSIYLRNYRFTKGRGNVQVTASFNSGYVPNSVIMVATALCGKYFGRSGHIGGYKSESIEGYTYQLLDPTQADEETKMLLRTLDGFKKMEL
jgi:hypothetical protein